MLSGWLVSLQGRKKKTKSVPGKNGLTVYKIENKVLINKKVIQHTQPGFLNPVSGTEHPVNFGMFKTLLIFK
jgi:hypothetical protein